MTRVTRRSAKILSHETSKQTQNYHSFRVSKTSSSDAKSDSSCSTMDSHPTQTSIISEKRKSVYSEIDDGVYFGKSSTEAVVGNSTYLLDDEFSDKEDELFSHNRSFRTPDWSKRVLNRDDYVNNVRHVLCSTSKKKQETSPRIVVTPHMSVLQSRLVKRASIAAEKEMALIEKRVSLKKANNSGNNLMQDAIVKTPARSSFIDLSKIEPVPMTIDKDVNPSPGTPSFSTPACGLDSPCGIRKAPSTSIGVNLRTSLFSKAATPVSGLGGAKRLTVQRASLEMSTILKGVVAYVEVRTNHDNLSQGVKTHLRTLGALIEENFTRKVTHVIFKEGLMSTYKKAERWRVPMVSALWIEACKSARKIVPAEEFPPIDLERYKNALPFKRFRKKRSIQPISDVRRLLVRSNRNVNKLATTAEEPTFAPPKEKLHIIEEINNELKNDKTIEDKYLQTLLTLAGPFLEEALNRSDSPTHEGDLYLPLSVRLLKKYMTPRGSQTESKLTRVSELEKHLNLNQRGRSRLRKFLVFGSEDEAETADKATQTDEESEDDDDTISPVQLPKVSRKSAPARMLTSLKKKRKNAKDTAQPKKALVPKPTVIVNKKKPHKAEDKENISTKNTDGRQPVNNIETERKTQKPAGKINSALKRKLLPTSQVIMLDAPVEDLSISKPVQRKEPLFMESFPKKRKVPAQPTLTSTQGSGCSSSSSSRYSEIYRLVSSDQDERNSTAWFAPPKRNKPLPKPVLVCTSLHTDESERVSLIVSKLGLFEIESRVNAQTTHVVAGGPRRTLNLVKGIARGCWIVKLDWALESAKAGRWLYEEPYELTEFSPAIKEVRLLRQSYKFLFSLDIFAPCGSIYVCQKTVPPRDDLKEILRLCSGAVVSMPKSAKIIIGNSVAGTLNVQEKWVLDCISQNRLIDTKSYIIKRNEIKG